MNKQLGNGQLKEAKESYEACVSEGHSAGDCITCRKCEGACPQHLPISDHLKKAAEMFGH
jgi:predicted aldo/keto reductase-like oxidoreductase